MKIYGQNKVIQELVNTIEVKLQDLFNQNLGIDALKDAIKNLIPSPILFKKKNKGDV